MFNGENWKKKINKYDLISVLIFGITAAILGGILAGLLDATIWHITAELGFSISVDFSLLIVALIVGFAVKKGYVKYHVLYSALAIGLFFVGLFFSYIGELVALLAINKAITGPEMFFRYIGMIFSRGDTYYSFFLPINLLLGGFRVDRFIFFLFDIIFLVLGVVAVYKISIDNNKKD